MTTGPIITTHVFCFFGFFFGPKFQRLPLGGGRGLQLGAVCEAGVAAIPRIFVLITTGLTLRDPCISFGKSAVARFCSYPTRGLPSGVLLGRRGPSARGWKQQLEMQTRGLFRVDSQPQQQHREHRG